MASFNEPSFQDRVASAAKAKQKALDRLKARPRVDPAILAERGRAWEAGELGRSEERVARAQANAAAKAERASTKAAQQAEESAAALKAARLKPPTPAEMKSARDARYAARQARKK